MQRIKFWELRLISTTSAKPYTNIQVKHCQRVRAATPAVPSILSINGQTFNIPYGHDLLGVAIGEDIAFVNNNLDIVQVSINLGSFAGTYGINAGTKIEITK